MQALKLLGQQLSKIWNQLGINQRVVIIISGLAVAAGLGGLVFWSSRTDYGLLYGKLDQSEAGEIIQSLEEMGTQYKTGRGGQAIYVPNDEVARVRMRLATKGLPKNDGVGFEIFERQSFGMSDFLQRVNYDRAIQGELVRAIQEFDGVEMAKVMITRTENKLLVNPDKKPTASVLVKMNGMKQLDANAVNAIRLMVANSVEGLKTSAVAVLDSSGKALSEDAEDGSLAQLSSTQLALRRNIERYLQDKVKTMLETVLGPDQVVVSVSAEINSESVTKSDEFYHPNERTLKSLTELNQTNTSTTPTASGVPGTFTNISTEVSGPGRMTQDSTTKSDTQKEFALSRSTTNIIRQAGGLTRVSAAVWVNTNTTGTNLVQAMDTNMIIMAVENALGVRYGVDGKEIKPTVSVNAVAFNREKVAEYTMQLQDEQRTELLWKVGKSLLYFLLALGALIGFYRLVKTSSEELLPTGIPVGQLIGGQVVYETPVAQPGMALPTGVVQTIAEQKVDEVVAGDEDVESLQAAKSKLVMDFGLGQQAPERITIEVLKQLIRENPSKMSQAARSWMSHGKKETDEAEAT